MRPRQLGADRGRRSMSGARDLTGTERRALGAAILLLPAVLAILGLWLLRDLWPPFRSVVVLFFLGWLVAFVLDPMVARLTRALPRLSRGVATAIAFGVVAIVGVGLAIAVGASVAGSVADLAARRSSLAADVAASLEPLRAWAASVGVTLDMPALVADAQTLLRERLDAGAASVVPAMLELVGAVLTIVFIGTVMVANKEAVLLFVRRLVGPAHLGLFDRFSAEVTGSFGGFIRGQFGLAALYGLIVALLAGVLGIPLAPVIGLATMLLQTIPWFGQLVSWIPLVAMTLAFRPDLLLPVLLVMLAGWMVLQNLVAPRVLGSAVGLHPLAVLAAVFIGGALAGPLGAVFGVPVAAAVGAVFLAWLDVVRPARRMPPPTRRRPRRRRTRVAERGAAPG